MADRSYDADVAIIGYGPSGVSAANILGANGIRTIAFERWTDIYQRARAVTTNDWTLRCFQSVGLDAALKAGMDETHSLRWITYDGRVLNHIGFPGGNFGHYQSHAIYQPVMEQTLRDGAARFADHVEVRYGADVVDVAQDADGVTITVRTLGTGQTTTTRARYALACDGGSSSTRERLGIALLGDTVETKWVIIDAKVKRWWPDRHILTFWSDKERPAVDIALSMGTHRWELPLKPGETEADLQSNDQLWPLLNAMGVTDHEVEIDQHAFYKHHIRSAERWRDGRVFLLGDAAHLMPPWAGQGMQSGIRDAFNLCWKLIEVLGGRLPDAVLDTYQPERAPDVEKYTRISIGLGRIIKQELSDEELAAMQPQPGAAPPPSPLLEPPVLHTGWITGDAGPDNAVGKMIPQPRVARSNGVLGLLDDVIGNGFVLLGDDIDPATLLDPDQRAAWDRLRASYRAVRSPDQRSLSADDIIDIEGTFTAWMRRHGARAVAIRPDRFVAAAEPGGLIVPGMISRRTAMGVAAGGVMATAAVGAAGRKSNERRDIAMSAKIDTHQHFLPRVYVDAIGLDALANVMPTGKAPEWSEQAAIDMMDGAGIAEGIISISSGPHIPDAANLLRQCNEEAAAIRQRHKGRFGSFASLPLPDADSSLKEIAYSLDVLKADGFILFTNYGGKYLGDPVFAPVMEELNRRKAVAFVHPNHPPYDLPGLPPASVLEFPFDTTRTAASLILAGAMKRWPDIQFILSHAGGALPYLSQRLTGAVMMNPGLADRIGDPMEAIQAFWFDTALSLNKPAMAALLTVANPGRILFGTDFPMAPPLAIQASVAGLVHAPLDEDLRAGIGRGNAARLLKRVV